MPSFESDLLYFGDALYEDKIIVGFGFVEDTNSFFFRRHADTPRRYISFVGGGKAGDEIIYFLSSVYAHFFNDDIDIGHYLAHFISRGLIRDRYKLRTDNEPKAAIPFTQFFYNWRENVKQKIPEASQKITITRHGLCAYGCYLYGDWNILFSFPFRSIYIDDENLLSINRKMIDVIQIRRRFGEILSAIS